MDKFDRVTLRFVTTETLRRMRHDLVESLREISDDWQNHPDDEGLATQFMGITDLIIAVTDEIRSELRNC